MGFFLPYKRGRQQGDNEGIHCRATWLKVSRLRKFYTASEQKGIKNIHYCFRSKFKIIFIFNILSAKFGFGTRLAIIKNRNVRNHRTVKKTSADRRLTYTEKQNKFPRRPSPPPQGRRGPPKKPPPLTEPSSHRNIPPRGRRKQPAAAPSFQICNTAPNVLQSGL